MPKQVGDLELYNADELAQLLGIPKSTVSRFFKERRFRGRKLGRKWYTTVSAIWEYFEQEEPPRKRRKKSSIEQQ